MKNVPLFAVFIVALLIVIAANVTSMGHLLRGDSQKQNESPSYGVPKTDPSLQRSLEAAQEQISTLEAKVEEQRKQLLELQQQQSTEKCTTSSSFSKTTSQQQDEEQQTLGDNSNNMMLPTSTAATTRSPMCSVLPEIIPSTLHLWNSYLPRIIAASQHENDRKYTVHDFTAELLHLVSPDRMDRSIVGLPHQWTVVKRVMTKAWERYQYTLNQEGPEKPKVKILVMGGSLIVGVNCRKIIPEHNLGFLMPNRLCTWTHRLETFLNKMLAADVFEVAKVALGGTNTETGHVLLEQDFLPPEAKNADILINAYSTNDMHIITVLEARSGNQTLREKVMEMTQHFVRTALKDGDCAPLLLHMDDYLGNEQREILTTTELSQAVQTLSAYYGFAAMSYANVIRDIVYGDTKEGWVSPKGWYEGGEMVREIHPGMGMHIVSSWVAAYNMLNLALTYCTIEGFEEQTRPVDETQQVPYESIQGLPKLLGRPKISAKPHGRPRGLPPPLTASLSLENVTALWKKAKPLQRIQNASLSSCPSSGEARCPFSWISGLTKAGLNTTYATELFVTTAKSNSGWIINSDGGKIGVSPDGPVAENTPKKLQLEVRNLHHEITTLTMFYMKSYGTKWAYSRIRLAVLKRDSNQPEGAYQIVGSAAELVGFHGKNTSETYTHRMTLEGISAGNDLQMEVELIGGTTFKIMGLATCK